jgi:hypothetical protein
MKTALAFPRPAAPISEHHQIPAHQRRSKRARDLAKRLTKLVAAFPEFRAILKDPLELLRDQANRTPENDRVLVLRAIHVGAWTIDDLRTETRLARPELQRLLDGLLAANIIITGTRKERNTTGGRPKLLYLPAPNFQP